MLEVQIEYIESGDKNCVLCVCTLHRFIPMSGISINTGLLTTHKYAHITKKRLTMAKLKRQRG